MNNCHCSGRGRIYAPPTLHHMMTHERGEATNRAARALAFPPVMPRRIESLFLAGPAGRLEALLEEPADTAPTGAALVCHPHPQHGGTMHNKVVYRVARGLRASGHAVLRFNYRGVNLSEGEYAHGEGELDDARAALAVLRTRYPEDRKSVV